MESPATRNDRDIPRYQQVADQIADMIATGAFSPGARVPSLRKLSKQMSVSLTTAMEAYRVLEDRDLIEARPQSGFYVRSPRKMPPAPAKTTGAPAAVTLDIPDLFVRMLREKGEAAFVPFGAAVPHSSFLPTERLNRILAREVRQRPETSQAYDEGLGYGPLRTRIARRALDVGCTLNPDHIITTAGAQQAILLALLALAAPGDTVVVETPTYPGLLQVLEALHLRALEVATDPDDGICLECLSDTLDRQPVAACVLVPTFGNPLGHCMPEPKRRDLLALLTAKGVPLVEDDVYGELFFDRSRPRAVKAFDEEGIVLLCSSFSKTLAPGYRVGWIAPGRYLQEVERQKYITTVASPTPTQMAVACYLEGGAFDRHLRRLRGTYRGLVARASCAIAEHFPQGTKLTRPRGGHVLALRAGAAARHQPRTRPDVHRLLQLPQLRTGQLRHAVVRCRRGSPAHRRRPRAGADQERRQALADRRLTGSFRRPTFRSTDPHVWRVFRVGSSAHRSVARVGALRTVGDRAARPLVNSNW
jgi:DNA-binding transcriptional MocR family regulator